MKVYILQEHCFEYSSMIDIYLDKQKALAAKKELEEKDHESDYIYKIFSREVIE